MVTSWAFFLELKVRFPEERLSLMTERINQSKRGKESRGGREGSITQKLVTRRIPSCSVTTPSPLCSSDDTADWAHRMQTVPEVLSR